MRSDESIKLDVIRELEREPALIPSSIAVAVDDGVVTLSGHVNTYGEKARTEDAVYRVRDIRAIAQELEVRLRSEHERNDSDIAEAVANALASNAWVPSQRIKIQVENGLVKLEGNVRSRCDRQSAEDRVKGLMGVRGVVNLLHAPPKTTAEAVHDCIEKELHQMLDHDICRINVDVKEGTVTLNGTVRSRMEREDAERAAYHQKGVSKVVNYLNVAPP